jgi:hypothetical protein
MAWEQRGNIRGPAGSGGGSEGAMVYQGIWEAGTYPAGSVVKRDGSVYVALQETTEAPVVPDSDIGTDFVGTVYTVAPWAVVGLSTGQTVTTVSGQTIPGETATTAMQLYGIGTSGGGDFHVTLTLDFDQAGTVAFQDTIASENGWDFGSFELDGVQMHQVTGAAAWTQREYAVGAGTHVLKWRFRGDGGTGGTADAYKVAALRTTGSIVASEDWDLLVLG